MTLPSAPLPLQAPIASDLSRCLDTQAQSSITHNCQKAEAAQGPIAGWVEWVNKVWPAHVVGYHSAVKMTRHSDTCYNMHGLEDMMLSAISPAQKDKHYVTPHLYGT